MTYTTKQLHELAEARFGVDAFSDWLHGTILFDVWVSGGLVSAGDAVLFTPSRGKSIKVWHPKPTMKRLFVVPSTHVEAKAFDQ